MKINKYTAVLAALGIVSLASVAQAANPVVYLTGSTAARTLVAKAMLTPGAIFDGSSIPSIVSPSPNNTSTGTLVVFEGPIGGTTVDISCSWNGSEAGLGSLAGGTVINPANGAPLPGSPASFLTSAAPVWTTTSVEQGDLAMADTSKAVSLNPNVNYTIAQEVGIVPFTIMKGYVKTPDTGGGYSELNNVTAANMNVAVAGFTPVSAFTGDSSDSDFVGVCGRNAGSGTRVNALLNFLYPVGVGVTQYAYGYYPTATPNLLTFGFSGSTTANEYVGANYTIAGTDASDVGDDGFDSGGNVANSLQVDATGATLDGVNGFLIGYLGMSDAKTAAIGTAGAGSGSAVYLSFNGVYESDAGVEYGSYTYWGGEHLYGKPGLSTSSEAYTVANLLDGASTGLNKAMSLSSGAVTTNFVAGACPGDVRTTSQSVLIPLGSMQVTRGGDGGFPTP